MELTQDFDYRIFDSLIDKNVRFALFRYPAQKEIYLILQHSGDATILDSIALLNEKKGFVIAPFHISADCPVVIISPDITLKGEDSIIKYFANKEFERTASHTDIHSQTSANSLDQYKTKYEVFLSALQEGQFQKLVLSRTFDYNKKKSLSSGIMFKKACETYPFNFIFLCNTPETGTWLGISPELLLSEDSGNCKTVALAGTKDIDTKEWDEKNRNEQQIVVDYMKEQLTKSGHTYTLTEPFTAQSGNIHHLKTEFTFKLDGKDKIGNLLDLLHPSPAVCGFPKEEAFDFIIKNEGYDRSYYSGFIGTLDIEGKSDLYVNLRCMQIGDNILRMYAGGGLLPSSNLNSEWEETENKLQTILKVVDDNS